MTFWGGKKVCIGLLHPRAKGLIAKVMGYEKGRGAWSKAQTGGSLGLIGAAQKSGRSFYGPFGA